MLQPSSNKNEFGIRRNVTASETNGHNRVANVSKTYSSQFHIFNIWLIYID